MLDVNAEPRRHSAVGVTPQATNQNRHAVRADRLRFASAKQKPELGHANAAMEWLANDRPCQPAGTSSCAGGQALSLIANLGRAAPRCAIDSRLHRILHRCDEFVDVKGFPNQAYALRENSTFHVRLIGVGGDEDDRRILPRLVTAQKLQQFQTADSWQIDIQHEHLDTNVVENGSCGGGVVHHGCAPTRHVVEQLTQEFSNRFVVIDNQNRQCRTHVVQHRSL
jgi:hypothetical protein